MQLQLLLRSYLRMQISPGGGGLKILSVFVS